MDKIVLQFENQTKRILDVNDKAMPTTKIEVQGLKADERKGFRRNIMLVTRQVLVFFTSVETDFIRSDFYKIFNPHLAEIAKLMRDQLSAAAELGRRVQVRY